MNNNQSNRWIVTTMVSMSIVIFGLVGDRISIASQLSDSKARIESLELTNQHIYSQLEAMGYKMDTLNLNIHSVMDQQKFVLSKLGYADLIMK